MGIRQMWAGLRCQHDGTIGWVELCGKVGAHAGNWNPNGCQLYAVNLEVVAGEKELWLVVLTELGEWGCA